MKEAAAVLSRRAPMARGGGRPSSGAAAAHPGRGRLGKGMFRLHRTSAAPRLSWVSKGRGGAQVVGSGQKQRDAAVQLRRAERKTASRGGSANDLIALALDRGGGVGVGAGMSLGPPAAADGLSSGHCRRAGTTPRRCWVGSRHAGQHSERWRSR